MERTVIRQEKGHGSYLSHSLACPSSLSEAFSFCSSFHFLIPVLVNVLLHLLDVLPPPLLLIILLFFRLFFVSCSRSSSFSWSSSSSSSCCFSSSSRPPPSPHPLFLSARNVSYTQ